MLLRFVNVGRWKRNGSLTAQRARCNGSPGALAGTLARRVVRTDGRCSGVCSPRGADAHCSPAQKAQEGSTQILLLRDLPEPPPATCDMQPDLRHGCGVIRMPRAAVRNPRILRCSHKESA